MPQKARKNALLTKPLKILRDTFARQGNIGFTDLGKLSKWLVEQRRAIQPDEAFWRKLFLDDRFLFRAQIADEVAGLGCAAVLKKFAEKTGPDRTDYILFVDSLPDPVRFFIRSLDYKEVSAYFVDRKSVAFVSSASAGVWALCMEEADDLAPSFHPVDEAGVFDAVMYAWNSWRSVHEWEPSHLCVWMAMAMDELSTKAEILFDESVAVSQDGKRIQAADVVVAYSFEGRKFSFALHQQIEFRDRKILLGRLHALNAKPTFRKKTDDERLQDALKPRNVRKLVSELQAQRCAQGLLAIGAKRILFTPAETIPPAEKVEPPKPEYPRSDKPERPPSEFDGMRPEDADLDGIAPNPFRDTAGDGLIGPAFDGVDEFDGTIAPLEDRLNAFSPQIEPDLNAPVHYGPQPVENVDCTDPAQKPPQRIETPEPSNPDAPKADEIPVAKPITDLDNDIRPCKDGPPFRPPFNKNFKW